MFRPLLAIFMFPKYFKASLQNCVRACWWKRSPCINPLIALFLVQMLCVSNEKVVSSGKYGGAIARPGHKSLCIPRKNTHISILDMIWYDVIYLLTAIGLSPGGSSAVHIYTQTIHRTIQNKQYIEQHNNWKSADRAPSWLVIPWHLHYNRGKSTERPQSG